MKTQIFLFALILALAACASQPNKEEAAGSPAAAAAKNGFPSTIQEAVASPTYRSAENRPRDQYRHPAETLEFFGLQPNMTVVEIWPHTGWYTEIVAPYLSQNGHYIAAANPRENPETKSGNVKLSGWIKAHPEVKIEMTEFAPPYLIEIAPPGTADMVVTYRNVHNWMTKGGGEKAAFVAFYKALKPGGILGVVEHRAAGKRINAKSGYLPEKFVIGLAEKAGFKLVAQSEINANSKDTKDYPNGVWTLPPANRHEAADDAKYQAIGESDRMTLKFVKPEKAKKAKKEDKKAKDDEPIKAPEAK